MKTILTNESCNVANLPYCLLLVNNYLLLFLFFFSTFFQELLDTFPPWKLFQFGMKVNT